MVHLGLIGGIGPAATIVYYQRLTKLAQAAGIHIDMTIAHADVQVLIKNNLADDRTAQAKVYAKHIESLRAAGCTHAAITSLGGHFCFEETQALSSLPLISAVAPLDDHFAALGIKRIGLLGTEVVMRTKLYGQLQKTEAVAPNQDLVELGRIYREMAVRGSCTEAERQHYFQAGAEMAHEQGADTVILAGTDLNLAFDNQEPGYDVVDALDVHVQVLFDLARASADKEL